MNVTRDSGRTGGRSKRDAGESSRSWELVRFPALRSRRRIPCWSRIVLAGGDSTLAIVITAAVGNQEDRALLTRGRNALPAISPRSLMKVTKVIFRVEWGDTRLFKSTMGAAIFPKKCVQVFPATRRCASNLTF